MESLIRHASELVAQIDTPTQASVACLMIVGFVVYGLFKPESGKLKLIALSGLLFAAGAVLLTIHHLYHVTGPQAHPGPPGEVREAALDDAGPAATAGMSVVPLPWPDANDYADSPRGWIYGGRYDRGENHWIERNIEVLSAGDAALPGQGDRVRTLARLQLYDEQPKFTIFGSKWKLGAPIQTIPEGTRLTVLEECTLIETNVWCPVASPG